MRQTPVNGARPPGAAGVDVAESDDIGIPEAARLQESLQNHRSKMALAGWIVG